MTSIPVSTRVPDRAAAVAPHARPHVSVWLVWAVAALAVLQLAPTPFVVLLVIGISVLIVETHAQHRGMARAFPLLVGAAGLFAVLRVALTAVTTHGGTDVMARLPSVTLPALVGGFTVGGTVHQAIVLRAAAEGLVVVGVIAALAAFNAVVSHHELLRLVPSAFHELGLVVSIALAFVPSTLTAVTAVREADQARTGLAGRRRGRWLRMLGPVLDTSLERAVALAESMESRGFGRRRDGSGTRTGGVLAVVAVLALSGAFGALLAGAPTVAAAAASAAVCMIVAAVVTVSRDHRRPRLRARRFRRADGILLAASAAAPVALALLSLAGAPLHWDVGAQSLPPLPAAAVPATLLLAAPAVAVLVRESRT